MNREEVKNKIESIQTNSEYMRVSEKHPLELYLGKNEKGNPTLRFNGIFQPVKVIGNALLEVKQVKTTNYNSLLFCFNSKENISLFYNFCEDVINETATYSGDNGYIEIVNRYMQWKKMFYGATKLLSENEIVGLIGELLFLKSFALEKYGKTVGLNGWSGPEPTHKDFSFENEWYEIKTNASAKNLIHISSIEQLDSESKGYLIVYTLEKMSPSFNGVSLNSLVEQIMKSLVLDNDKDVFIEKLKQVGYAYNEVYDNYVYRFVSTQCFAVKDNFPRIKYSQLPLGVTDVTYDILITLIEKYKEELS